MFKTSYIYILLVYCYCVLGVIGADNIAESLYYITEEGYLVRYNAQESIEIGQTYLTRAPANFVKVDNKLYITDQINDQIIIYDLNTHKQSSHKINNAGIDETIIYQDHSRDIPKSNLRKAVESTLGKKGLVKISKNNNNQLSNIPVIQHKQNLGLNQIISDNKYLYINAPYKNKILVYDLQLKPIQIWNINTAINDLVFSPDKKSLALISSTSDYIFIINPGNLKKVNLLATKNAPIKALWLNNTDIAVLNRASHNIQIYNTLNNTTLQSYDWGSDHIISDMQYQPKHQVIYAISPDKHLLYILPISNLQQTQSKAIDEQMQYPQDIFLQGDQLYISSPDDHKLLITDPIANTEHKIRLNLTLKELLI